MERIKAIKEIFSNVSLNKSSFSTVKIYWNKCQTSYPFTWQFPTELEKYDYPLIYR